MPKLVVLALGGNALIRDAQHQTVADQFSACLEAAEHIVKLLEEEIHLIVTHGNGPQVGFIARRSEIARKELHPVPLNACVADTQGALGAIVQRAIHNKSRDMDQPPNVTSIVTQVIVDDKDQAFVDPAKPIGSFMDKATADQRVKEDDWRVIEDANRGYRRVVPSPIPKEVVELSIIKQLAEAGIVTVAAGGGGIPVVRRDNQTLEAVDAVIDKDRTSSLIAQELEADILMIATAVEHATIYFQTPQEQKLERITVAEAEAYIAEGHFGKGSMLPKMEAATQYVKQTGKQAIITNPTNITKAFQGLTGTHIIP